MVNLDHQLLASFNVPYRLVNPGNLTPNLNRGVVEVGAGLSDKAMSGEKTRRRKKTRQEPEEATKGRTNLASNRRKKPFKAYTLSLYISLTSLFIYSLFGLKHPAKF